MCAAGIRLLVLAKLGQVGAMTTNGRLGHILIPICPMLFILTVLTSIRQLVMHVTMATPSVALVLYEI